MGYPKGTIKNATFFNYAENIMGHGVFGGAEFNGGDNFPMRVPVKLVMDTLSTPRVPPKLQIPPITLKSWVIG